MPPAHQAHRRAPLPLHLNRFGHRDRNPGPDPYPYCDTHPAPRASPGGVNRWTSHQCGKQPGAEQWGLSNAALGKIFSPTATGFGVDPQHVVEAGSNLALIDRVPQDLVKIAELDRTGKVLGIGTVPVPANYSAAPVVSPTGTEWAWSIDESPASELGNIGPGPPYYRHHGVIEVGGLGEPNRTVYQWLAPANFSEQLDGWTNTGLIIQRWEYGGCGILYDPAAAWFAINPSTGTLTELFTGNDQFMGASSGVTVAALINDAHAVLINGVTYSESKSTIVGANISPDGAHVAVSRISDYEGCAGYTPKNTVEMVTVANQSHVDLQNLTAEGWWDADQFIANNLSGSTWIYTLEGKAVSEICSASSSSSWGLSGVLAG